MILDAYTMKDIEYVWRSGDKSVMISPDVSLPQFRVAGTRQKVIKASLSTGWKIVHEIVKRILE